MVGRGHPARQAPGPLAHHAGRPTGQERGAARRASRCSSPRVRSATSSSPASAASSPTSASSSPTATSSGPTFSRLPRLGMINVHASLLPALARAPRRSSTPSWPAIRETGVSIMQMEAGTRQRAGAAPGRHADRRRRDRRRARRRASRSSAPRRWSTRCRCSPAGSRGREPQDDGRRDARAQDRPRKRPGSTGAGTRRRSRARSARSIRRPAPGPRTSRGPLKLFGARRRRRSRASPAACSPPATGWWWAAATARSPCARCSRPGSTRLPVSEWVRGRGIAVGARLG